jgi:hypothetical protein
MPEVADEIDKESLTPDAYPVEPVGFEDEDPSPPAVPTESYELDVGYTISNYSPPVRQPAPDMPVAEREQNPPSDPPPLREVANEESQPPAEPVAQQDPLGAVLGLPLQLAESVTPLKPPQPSVVGESKPEASDPAPAVVNEKSPEPPSEVEAPGVTALVVSAPPPKFTEKSESYKAKQAAKDDRREQKRGVTEGPKTKQQDRADKQRQTTQQQGPFAAIREGVQRRRVDRDEREQKKDGGQGDQQADPTVQPPWMPQGGSVDTFPFTNAPPNSPMDSFLGGQSGSIEGTADAVARTADQMASFASRVTAALEELNGRLMALERILDRSFGA